MNILGYDIEDETSLNLVKTYARCLALPGKHAKWKAQLMFHRAQIARDGGGTRAMVLGSELDKFLQQYEQ